MPSVADTLKGLGKTQLMLMGGVGLMLLVFFAIIAMRVAAPSFTNMYTGLNMEDSVRITAQLESQGIPYQTKSGGSIIAVPTNQMLRLRMSMAEQGMPSRGNVMGYEIFDKSETFGSSQFVLNVNAMRALEGELARTIGAFQQVESARVHLVMPKRELFSRDKMEPTASVALKLRGNMELEKAEIASIVNFVAAAVPGLKPGKVTLVDNFGRLLARAEEEGSMGAMINDATEFRNTYELRMRNKLEELVEKVVGPGRVQIKVTADINFDRLITNKETFDPDGQVARSVQSASETEAAKEGGADEVTVGNQLPGATAGSGNSGSNRDVEKTEETTNYEISKTIENYTKEGGSVNKLSVAVLVDGNYVDVNGDMTYQAREQDELDRISTLVKSAMGFDQARGDVIEVVSMRFVKPEEVIQKESFLDKFQDKIEGIVQTFLIVIIVLIIIFTVIRPMLMHVIRTSAPATERLAEGLASISGAATTAFNNQAAVAGAGGGATPPGMASIPGSLAGRAQEIGSGSAEDEVLINFSNIKGGVRSSVIKQVSDFVDSNPDETILVVRQWMNEEQE